MSWEWGRRAASAHSHTAVDGDDCAGLRHTRTAMGDGDLVPVAEQTSGHCETDTAITAGYQYRPGCDARHGRKTYLFLLVFLLARMTAARNWPRGRRAAMIALGGRQTDRAWGGRDQARSSYEH